MGLEGSLLLTFSPLSTEKERKREKETDRVNIEGEGEGDKSSDAGPKTHRSNWINTMNFI